MPVSKTLKPKTLSVSPRCYRLIRLLAETNRRKFGTQVEVLAEEECKRQNITIPTEPATVNSSKEF